MPTETLNISYHTRDLLLRALNSRKTKVQAYMALGISEKQLFNLIHKYEVKRGIDGKYYSDKIIIFRKDETPTSIPAVSGQP